MLRASGERSGIESSETSCFLSIAPQFFVWPCCELVLQASLSLALELVERAWMVPGWDVLQIPLVVPALSHYPYYRGTILHRWGPVTSVKDWQWGPVPGLPHDGRQEIEEFKKRVQG